MIQLLIIYYFPGLVLHKPIWGGGEAGRFLAAAFSFILNYACYFSEIYRGGIQGVPAGQEEAGLVLGMTRSQIFFKITLLQMMGGAGVYEGFPWNIRSNLAVVLYRGLLSGLQRYPDAAAWTAGA